jgi:hypothetical protein
MGYLFAKWDFWYYLYSVIKKTRACEFFVKSAREIVEVVDYSITKTK